MPPVAASTFALVLIVVAALIALLAIGGYVAAAQQMRARRRDLLRRIEEAESGLADARASDRGWDRATMEEAVRRAVAERFAAAEVQALQLVQVVDRPGTDADQAVFRVQTADGEHHITLGRSGGVWGAAE